MTLHTILLGVSVTFYIEHTLHQFIQLGLYHQRAIKLARKVHAHLVMYANKLVRRAIENNLTSHNQIWSRVLPLTLQITMSTLYFTAMWWKGLTALLSQI
eukprot:1147519-Pelagomonas_calceolata.AAC.1